MNLCFQGLYLNLVSQYGGLGRVEEARGAVDRLRARHPESPVVILCDGLIELIYGDAETALGHFVKLDEVRQGMDILRHQTLFKEVSQNALQTRGLSGIVNKITISQSVDIFDISIDPYHETLELSDV